MRLPTRRFNEINGLRAPYSTRIDHNDRLLSHIEGGIAMRAADLDLRELLSFEPRGGIIRPGDAIELLDQ